jgi:hypothetical protein
MMCLFEERRLSLDVTPTTMLARQVYEMLAGEVNFFLMVTRPF